MRLPIGKSVWMVLALLLGLVLFAAAAPEARGGADYPEQPSSGSMRIIAATLGAIPIGIPILVGLMLLISRRLGPARTYVAMVATYSIGFLLAFIVFRRVHWTWPLLPTVFVLATAGATRFAHRASQRGYLMAQLSVAFVLAGCWPGLTSVYCMLPQLSWEAFRSIRWVSSLNLAYLGLLVPFSVAWCLNLSPHEASPK